MGYVALKAGGWHNHATQPLRIAHRARQALGRGPAVARILSISIIKQEVVPVNAMTKEIHIRPTVKVIGNTEYYVECFFNDNAAMNLTGKVKRLIGNDLKSQTEPLLSLQSKVTSHNPAGVGSDKEVEV